jgi:hypothetical protein
MNAEVKALAAVAALVLINGLGTFNKDRTAPPFNPGEEFHGVQASTQFWPVRVKYVAEVKALYNLVLPVCVTGSDNDSGSTDNSGGPKTNNLRLVPEFIALALGALLIGVSVYILNKTVDSNGGPVFFWIVVGWFPFALGFYLIFCCILPPAPPFFGFAIGNCVSP